MRGLIGSVASLPGVGILAGLLFVVAGTRAEGPGTNPPGASSDRHIYAVSGLRTVPGGFIAVGGPALRRLTAGARKWETLLAIAGDNLYRVAVDDTGRLLAAWEKHRSIHLFGADGREQGSFSKPDPVGAGITGFQIADVAFQADGRNAIVYMTGYVQVTTGSFRGPSWSTAAYRVALDGRFATTVLFRVDHGYRLHTSRRGAIFAMPTTPGRKCDHGECVFTTVVAFEIVGDRVKQTTVFDAAGAQMGRARLMRGSDQDKVTLMLDGSAPSRLEIVRWAYGEARGTTQTLPATADDSRTTLLSTRAGDLIETRVRDGLLEIWRHTGNGPQQIANLKELQEADRGLYGIGERADGTLWLHYGDHIGLFSPGAPPRSYSLAPLLPRRSEWAGAELYVPSPEHLWVGIDGTGRDYVRVDFSDIEKRATPWPAGELIERVGGESASWNVKEAEDGSTSDRLLNASTLRSIPSTGDLFSIGGFALRRLPAGARRWETLLSIPRDSLYRVAADERGRLLAAWEKDPNLHLFSPSEKRHVTIAKPIAPTPAINEMQVEHLAFLPGGRDALVIMHGQIKNPPPRTVPEPVRFYYSTWATLAYRVALDGRTPPKLLYREDYGNDMFDATWGSVFAIPKYPGQECAYSTCMPITQIVAYEITDAGVRQTTLMRGEDVAPGYILSQAATVHGSNDDHLAIVVHTTDHRGPHWLNGTRGILRWRPGAARAAYRPLPGNNPLTPIWLLTRDDDFIELVEHWDKKPDTLEIHHYRANGSDDASTLVSLRKMSSPRGMGERAGGGLWLQYGDFLALLPPGQIPRAFDLDSLVLRGTEWAGAASYVAKPESLWIGLDGRGRQYARVDLATAEKKSKPWR